MVETTPLIVAGTSILITALGATYLLVRKITTDLIGVLKTQTLSIERMTHSIVAAEASKTATSMTGPAIVQQVAKIKADDESSPSQPTVPTRGGTGAVIRTRVQ